MQCSALVPVSLPSLWLSLFHWSRAACIRPIMQASLPCSSRRHGRLISFLTLASNAGSTCFTSRSRKDVTCADCGKPRVPASAQAGPQPSIRCDTGPIPSIVRGILSSMLPRLLRSSPSFHRWGRLQIMCASCQIRTGHNQYAYRSSMLSRSWLLNSHCRDSLI